MTSVLEELGACAQVIATQGPAIDRATLLEKEAAALVIAQADVDRHTAALEEATNRYKALSETILPGIMDDLGIPKKAVIDPATGATVYIKVGDKFRASYDNHDAERVKWWLKFTGNGGAITPRTDWTIHWATFGKVVDGIMRHKRRMVPSFIKVSPTRVAKVSTAKT